jgi:hypothetical protein
MSFFAYDGRSLSVHYLKIVFVLQSKWHRLGETLEYMIILFTEFNVLFNNNEGVAKSKWLHNKFSGAHGTRIGNKTHRQKLKRNNFPVKFKKTYQKKV